MAYIVKKNGLYQFQVSYYDENGDRKYITKGKFKRKVDAQAAADEIELKKYQVGISKNENITFAEYYKNWVYAYKIGKLDKSTESRYKTNAKFIEDNSKNVLLKEITKMDYQEMLDKYAETHVKHTVRRFNGTVSKAVQEALEERIIYRDFTRNVHIGGLDSKNKDLKFLENEDIEYLIEYTLSNASINNISLYEIALGILTGCRYGEVTGLTWDCVDFENQLIHINKAYDYTDQTGFKNTKTPSSIRYVAIDDKTTSMLKKLKKEQRELFLKQGFRDSNKLVFLNNRHKIISDEAVNKSLKKVLKEINASKEITFHGLRHSHASLLISKGISINYISERLGHSDTSVTSKVYIHMLKEYREKEKSKTISMLNSL